MGLVLKISGNNWINESRDKRELSVYRELGYEVAVLAKGEVNDRGREDIVNGFKVLRYTTRPWNTAIPESINRVVALFQWAGFAKKLQPDVITGHDLKPGLIIAWLVTLFNKKKPKLIYDSHEFELGDDNLNPRNGFQRWVVAKVEKFLMNRCVFSIMVNDSIADEVKRIHNLEERPLVVRNTPNYWEIDESVCRQQRQAFLDKFSAKQDNPFIIMYHGAFMIDRGIETLIDLVKINQNVCAVILGGGDKKYLNELYQLVQKNNVGDRVVFHSAVDNNDLWKYVGSVDLSFIMIKGTARNHFFSLPNKFFESIQSLTPILASNFPEMKRLVDKYKIGLGCDPNDLKAINACVEQMRTDKQFYQKCKQNLIKAKKELCWENEKNILVQAFQQKVMNVNGIAK